MKPNEVLTELMLRVREDRAKVAGEKTALVYQHEKLATAAAENTLSGHLRQAIHVSHRPLREIARDAGIDVDRLCRFLKGEEPVSSETLDRLAHAAGIVVTISREP
jgi:DNA-binding phage protein